MVRADGVVCEATVIDAVAGTGRAKRIRLQTGEHFGEVRMPADYELIDFITPHEDGPGKAELAGAMAEIGE